MAEAEFEFDANADSAGSNFAPTSEFQSIVDYQLRNSLFRSAQRTCLELLNRQPGNQEAKFWRAFAMQQEGAFNESIRELTPLQSVPELSLAVTASLLAAHSRNDSKDKETINRLKEDLKKYSSISEERALVFAGRYFWHAGKEKQSKQCLEKVLSKNKRNVEALVLFGWLNLLSGQTRNERKAVQLFDSVMKMTADHDKKDIGALLGRAHYYERKHKFDKALEEINQIIVVAPEFLSAINEKAKILLIRGDWDEALSTAARVLKRDSTDLQALRISILYALTRENKVELIKNRINDLFDALEKNEPRNYKLFYEFSQLIARLANRRRLILNQSLILIEKAIKLGPGTVHSTLLTEQGYQLTLLDDYTNAAQCFSEASKLEEGNLHALHGSIKVKILQGKLKEAQEELDFLSDIQSAVGITADLAFLHALLAWQREGKEGKAMEYLNETMALHSKHLETIPLGFDYFIAYNPDFVLEVIQQYSQHIGTDPQQAGDTPNPMLKNCVDLLHTLTQLVPGMVTAQLLLSKALFISGEFADAERTIHVCLKLDQQCAPAHLILAQIYLARDQYKQCSQALEQARALDFEIRNTPLYHLMKAKLLEASGQMEDALKVLQSAMELPGVRVNQAGAAAKAKAAAPVPLQDRISIYLELSHVYLKLTRIPESKKILLEAKSAFKDTRESSRVTIAEADLDIKQKDYDTALNLLRSIPHESQYYTRSKMRQAEIYLHYKRNKKMYILCYQEFSDAADSAHGFILLGEAYMKISEPEKAIKEYERALKKEPTHALLSSKIGSALISTHDYARAVRYYEAAISQENAKLFLFHELAQLYISLKQHEEALRVLERALEVSKAQSESGDVQSLQDDVKSFSLMADVYTAAGANTGQHVLGSLTKAWESQMEILNRLRDGSSEFRKEQKEIAANLCFRLAQYNQTHNNADQAIQYYNEALKHNEAHEKSRLALAKLHLVNGELDQCQSQCVTLMRLDPNNRDASIMLADIMFRKNEGEAAAFHFQQLLEKNPTRYEALIKLIQLLRRSGKLSEAPKFLKLAEKFNAAASFSAGLHYARGLYSWYSNDPREALIQFNYSRKDAEWGRSSIMNMIEIYLNPDNSDIFTENVEAKGDNSEQIAAAEKLLQELTKLGENSNQYKVLESYCHMASKSKPRIEKALTDLLTICELDQNYVPALLGCAVAYELLSQPTKAKNQLKRISKMKYDPDYALEFERSWLMLANTYIQVGKNDFASELCKKCLQNNKSSAKSWEMLGTIMEKEQNWAEAAEDYEHAWNFMNQSSPSIGFKLAFNYLKAKRFVEAIDVCHKVLAQFPDYPKIRKEILDKARVSLRP